MLIANARVSTEDQKLALQRSALKGAGCPVMRSGRSGIVVRGAGRPP